MNSQLLYLMILTSLMACSPKFDLSNMDPIKGSYSSPPGFSGRTYTFLDDNKFEYRYGSCTSEEYGEGVYAIKNDSIYFNFKQIDSNPRVNELKRTGDLSDSLKINVIVSSKRENELLPFSTVTISNRDTLLEGNSSDMSGETSFNIPFEDKPIIVDALFIGYHKEQIILNESGIYELKFYLQGRSKLIENEVKKYKLIKFTEDKLEYKGDVIFELTKVKPLY